MNVREHLQEMDAFLLSGHQPPAGWQSRYGLVAELGTEVAVTQGHPLMEQKRCFNNAIEQMSAGKDYVEGYVWLDDIPLAIAHAWNHDGARHIDHTFRNPSRGTYIGLKIPRDVVLKVACSKHFEIGEGVLGTIFFFADRTRDRLLKKIRTQNSRGEDNGS